MPADYRRRSDWSSDVCSSDLANPGLFDQEARCAKRVISGILDLDKPLICRLNGHAVGLGATLALFCDVIFAADNAKIGNRHVSIGRVAGDGGAGIWAHPIGLGRAKEFLLTGGVLTPNAAEKNGLVNHFLPLAVPAPPAHPSRDNIRPG